MIKQEVTQEIVLVIVNIFLLSIYLKYLEIYNDCQLCLRFEKIK